MLTLKVVNKKSEVVFERTHEDNVYLAMKSYTYQEGDKIVLTSTESNIFLKAQLDESLPESLVFLKGNEWVYDVILDEQIRRAYSPNIFLGERHYLWVRKAQDFEVNSYRNVALNPHDQKAESGVFPHADANVETRNDATFFARNAIDGLVANESHGSYPYQSWGINQQKDAEITIDFGRTVAVDKIALVLRGDYPHDSFWTEITVRFSDGQKEKINTTNSLDRQYFSFSKKKTRSITLCELIQNEDDSPFPALTELEVYGVYV